MKAGGKIKRSKVLSGRDKHPQAAEFNGTLGNRLKPSTRAKAKKAQ